MRALMDLRRPPPSAAARGQSRGGAARSSPALTAVISGARGVRCLRRPNLFSARASEGGDDFAWPPEGAGGQDEDDKSRNPFAVMWQDFREARAYNKERKACLERVLDLITTKDIVAPYTPSEYNSALTLWTAIYDVPPRDRMKLLGALSDKDIESLWRIAGEKYRMPAAVLERNSGPEVNLAQLLPGEKSKTPGQVQEFKGRATGFPTRLFNRFSKVFFFPDSPEADEVVGRVLLGKGPIAGRIYPLYFKAHLDSVELPATSERADFALAYVEAEDLPMIWPDELPNKRWAWPGRHRFPFNNGLVDYVRAVGPGVFVGKGWKGYKPEDRDLGRPFVYFILIERP